MFGSRFLDSVLRRQLSGEVQVERRLEEPRVAVLLHQRVDLALSQLKAGDAGLLQVLLGERPGLVIQVHLRCERRRVLIKMSTTYRL